MAKKLSFSMKFLAGYLGISLLAVGGYALSQQQRIKLADLQQTDNSQAAEPVVTKVTKDFVATQAFNQDGGRADRQNGKGNPWIGNASSTGSSYLGLRFPGVSLPAGASLQNAYISYSLPDQAWIGISVQISAEKAASPAAFANNNLPSKRVLGNAKVPFALNQKLTPNIVYTLPEIKSAISEVLPIGATQDINIIIKGTGRQWGRFFVYGPDASTRAPKLTLNYSITTGTNPTPVSTIAPTPMSSAIATPRPSQTAVSTPMPHEGGTGGSTSGNSVAFGKWSPSRFDTCTKEQHDAYSVIGPDGKRYPTYHPATGPGGCKFGHEHGRDPSAYQYWDEVRRHFAYDADKNGSISSTELASAGLPFGYINEQVDAHQSGSTNPIMRHEDHYGHKVQYANGEADVDREGRFQGQTNTTGGLVIPLEGSGGTDDWQNSGVRCNFLHKVHQGVSTPDALTNNLHELITHTRCTSTNNRFPASSSIVSGMVAFGAAGEFNEFCSFGGSRTTPIVLGKTASNSNWPGSSGSGGRAILTRDCIERFGQIPDFPYEIWNGELDIRRRDGNRLVSVLGGWEILDAVRYYDSTTANKIAYGFNWCYQGIGNIPAKTGSCDDMTNFGKIRDITWDDPRSIFKGIHRGQYMSPHRVFNDGGPEYWYSDPFGRNAQTTPFPGSIRQYISSLDADILQIGISDPRSIVSYLDDGNGSVHAPN